ncbi:MAG: YbaK/EbsC family protein [Bdellovibrionales bacterium]|nr:YbaK/EbsC family protein [Bdellovibrionales bacterium]
MMEHKPTNPQQLNSHQFLLDKEIPFERASFSTSTEKGAANVAQALGFKDRQMVKTLIYEIVDTGETVLVMLGGDQFGQSGKLKKAIGSRNIKMASFEKVKEITGYEVGSIPPFSWQPAGFRTFIERSLLEETKLGVGTGQWGEEIIISPNALVQASSAEVVDIAKED